MILGIPSSIASPLESADTQMDRSSGDSHLSDTFRRLYFHLYSNSNTSRAERIMDEHLLGPSGQALRREEHIRATGTRSLPGLRLGQPIRYYCRYCVPSFRV